MKKLLFISLLLIGCKTIQRAPRVKKPHPYIGMNKMQVLEKFGVPTDIYDMGGEDGYIIRFYKRWTYQRTSWDGTYTYPVTQSDEKLFYMTADGYVYKYVHN